MSTREATVGRRVDLQQAAMADFRQVTLTMRCGEEHSVNRYIVHRDDVDQLIDASKRLHHDPGINPHNRVKTAEVIKISVGEPRFAGPYWWTTPDLKANGDPSGASLINWSDRVVWTSPAYKEELRRWEESRD